MTIEEALEISSDKITYGLVKPGQIIEKDLKITNLSGEELVIKVVCLCTNKEFEDHDEYVYSVRKASIYDYNEKYFVLLPANSFIHFKVALKVPDYFKRIILRGNVSISIQQQEGEITIPISSLSKVPKFKCMKQLYSGKMK